MSLAEIEQSVYEAVASGDPEVMEMYAEHAAESLNELAEMLCLAIINTDHRAWASVLAVASQKAPALANALESIEQHIDRSRAAFIEARASKLADLSEHDKQCLAELQAELNRETCP